jgi:hypothetical protein
MRIVTFALLAMTAAPAAAQETYALKWSLKEGDKFFANNLTEMEMNMMVMGMPIEIKMDISAVQRFKVTAVKKDSTTIEMTILSMDMKAGALQNIPGFGGLTERMRGSTITAILDENMSVTKIQGYDKFIENVAGDDEAAKQVLKQQFSEATLGQMYTQVFSFGNSKPVKIGDTWQRNEKMAVSGFDAGVKMKYKLDSVTNGLAKMGWTGDMTFKAGDTIPGLPPGLKLDKFDMKVDKFGGTVKFDTKAGRLVEGTTNADMNATIGFAANGNSVEMTMKIKMKQSTTIGEKNPVKD